MNDLCQKTAFEIAHAKVVALLDHFAKYARDTYLLPGYQEAAARKDFIDPLLKALGWDVSHEREHNPYEQEVKVERGVSVCAVFDRQIDTLVYELYGLTDDEIALVDGHA